MKNLFINLFSCMTSPFKDDACDQLFSYPKKEEDTLCCKIKFSSLVGGFLSIGQEQGAKQSDGGSNEIGNKFIRLMLHKFRVKEGSRFSDFSEIIERSTHASSRRIDEKSSSHPLRLHIEDKSLGGKEHAVSRLVGSLGSSYRENGPFFEVLVDSRRTPSDLNCRPFYCTILRNREEAEERYQLLDNLEYLSTQVADGFLFDSDLVSPEKFIDEYQKRHQRKPGENALRMLEALKKLDSISKKGQVIGNCWIKQPKRAVLVTLFIETVTHRPEFNIERAWRAAEKIYGKWKAFVRQEILKGIERTNYLEPQLKELALDKIRRKSPN